MFKDYYQILGIKQGTKPHNIKKAYRRLALKYHPDRNADKEAAEEKFKIILEAYQTLSNKESRSSYDLEYDIRVRSYKQSSYEKSFAPKSSVRTSTPTPKKAPAQDDKTPVEYSWSEAVMGRLYQYLARKETSSASPPGVKPVKMECADCNGRGLRYLIFRCPGCAGEGYRFEVRDSVYKICPACRGGGYGELFFVESLCDYCDGLGIVRPKSKHSQCPHCQGYGWTLADSLWRKLFSLQSKYFIWQKEQCYFCEGSGASVAHGKNNAAQCPRCRGLGFKGINILRKKRRCPECKGSGLKSETDDK
jgi:DnaJ-class molecular chaperone